MCRNFIITKCYSSMFFGRVMCWTRYAGSCFSLANRQTGFHVARPLSVEGNPRKFTLFYSMETGAHYFDYPNAHVVLNLPVRCVCNGKEANNRLHRKGIGIWVAESVNCTTKIFYSCVGIFSAENKTYIKIIQTGTFRSQCLWCGWKI